MKSDPTQTTLHDFQAVFTARLRPWGFGAQQPKELPVTALIRNATGIADWKLFVKE